MKYEQLKLSNQLCFPVYATSRLITREYQPLLDELGITYPQYLVLMILWEKEEETVNAIAQKLILKTNTVTPLLKRMEKQGLLTRNRQPADERKVLVSLTKQGKALQEKAAEIPMKLADSLLESNFLLDELKDLKTNLERIIQHLSDKQG